MNYNKTAYIVYLAKDQNHVIIGEKNMEYIEEPNAKYTIKDSVFCDLFTKKEYLLQLYQFLHPEDENVTEEEVEVETLQNVLIDQMYNDLGFRVGNRLLILVEAQSTWSINILMRGLIYLAQTYNEYIQKNELNVYGSKKLDFPKPEFYVVFTGTRQTRPEYLSLSEEFFDGSDLIELKAKIFYDEDKTDILHQYITFTKIVMEQEAIYGRKRKAVKKAIKICRDRNILSKYLKEREVEVISMMSVLYDEEVIKRNYIKEVTDEAKECGRVEGHTQQAMETAIKLKKMGFSIEKIAEAVDFSVVVSSNL